MQRLKEKFIEKVEDIIPLERKCILEIGCGDGARSVAIAAKCKKLNAIDPDASKIEIAHTRNISNAEFAVGTGSSLPFDDHRFDAVIFTLSLHHISEHEMNRALHEAARVTKKDGHIVFLEPTETGSFFDAEISFDACDGDERKEKAMAYQKMMGHSELAAVSEMADETVFQFQSVEGFIEAMTPQKNLDRIQQFLETHNYMLRAGRRINIFSKNV